jgi:hypothetical protein
MTTEDDDELEMEPAVRELCASARRGRESLSDAQSLEILERVVGLARERRRRTRGAAGVLWFSSLAAGLALVGALTGPWSEPPTAVPGVVVKHMSFESVHGGKVTRLEITVYRTDEKEEADAPNPSL